MHSISGRNIVTTGDVPRKSGMPNPSHAPSGNRAEAGGGVDNALLRALPPAELSRLTPSMERVSLRPRQLLHHAGTPMPYAYFIESGLVSVSARAVPPSRWVDVWLVGSDGMVGLPIALGDLEDPPLRRIVRIGGSAWRIPRQDLRRAIDSRPALRSVLLRYAGLILLQASQWSVCNATHNLKQRLARWLLLAGDALGKDDVPLTHDVLARLLGVRRASITECLAVLEDAGAIATGRGLVVILRRDALERLSCGCYRLIRSEHRKALETPP